MGPTKDVAVLDSGATGSMILVSFFGQGNIRRIAKAINGFLIDSHGIHGEEILTHLVNSNCLRLDTACTSFRHNLFCS